MLAKYLQSINPTGSRTYVEDVFSTYLYTGNGSTQTITNGIDLSTRGGLVWIKGRDSGYNHQLFDTVRGANFRLQSNSTSAASTAASADYLSAFTTSGFSLGANNEVNGQTGGPYMSYVGWTFRKAPKFFDVVTWTGNGVGARQIAHSLGQTPGMIIAKSVSAIADWYVYHRSTNVELKLNTTEGSAALPGYYAFGTDPNDYSPGMQAAPTSTYFTTGAATNSSGLNANGITYVAYLFAHDTSANGLIQCGSYTGTAQTVTLGWEPQFLLTKQVDQVGTWQLVDVMRDWSVGTTNDPYLQPNSSATEAGGTCGYPTATGFVSGGNGGTSIYLAIRRGPMRQPTSGTQVYATNNSSGTNVTGINITCGFTADFMLSRNKDSAGNQGIYDRLRGASAELITRLTNTEGSQGPAWDVMDGMKTAGDGNQTYNNPSVAGNVFARHFLRRHPGVFDIVCYTGTGSARTIAHNLGVPPEIIIGKSRSGAFNWYVYHAGIGATKGLYLNATDAAFIGTYMWNDTSPTASAFSLGTGGLNVNADVYVTYLFATLAGISKVGSYTGNGSNQTIDCGFAAGARFVLIKRTDSVGDWYLWDSTRGIVAGNDPHLSVNDIPGEVTTDDSLDPVNSGFIVNQLPATNINASSAMYIYLAIS